jgi:transcriptional regulator with XRE-family HTH domain
MKAAEAFPDRLRRLRKAAGLSRESLALRAGCSWKSVQAWEQGRRGPPSLDLAAGLARALGVSLDVLAGGKNG